MKLLKENKIKMSRILNFNVTPETERSIRDCAIKHNMKLGTFVRVVLLSYLAEVENTLLCQYEKERICKQQI